MLHGIPGQKNMTQQLQLAVYDPATALTVSPTVLCHAAPMTCFSDLFYGSIVFVIYTNCTCSAPRNKAPDLERDHLPDRKYLFKPNRSSAMFHSLLIYLYDLANRFYLPHTISNYNYCNFNLENVLIKNSLCRCLTANMILELSIKYLLVHPTLI